MWKPYGGKDCTCGIQISMAILPCCIQKTYLPKQERIILSFPKLNYCHQKLCLFVVSGFSPRDKLHGRKHGVALIAPVRYISE